MAFASAICLKITSTVPRGIRLATQTTPSFSRNFLDTITSLLAVAGAGATIGLTPSRVASVFDTGPGPVQNTRDTEGLASAVTKWGNESPQCEV